MARSSAALESTKICSSSLRERPLRLLERALQRACTCASRRRSRAAASSVAYAGRRACSVVSGPHCAPAPVMCATRSLRCCGAQRRDQQRRAAGAAAPERDVERGQAPHVLEHAVVDLEADADPGDRPRARAPARPRTGTAGPANDTMAEASPRSSASCSSDANGNGRPTNRPPRCPRRRAVERDQEDGVGVDARAVVREHGRDGRAVGGGDGLAEREVARQHAQRVGELARARLEDAVEHARADAQLVGQGAAQGALPGQVHRDQRPRLEQHEDRDQFA